MSDHLQDQTLKCCRCGEDHVFTVRDQIFFQQNGWGPPKRCRPCRDELKIEREERKKK